MVGDTNAGFSAAATETRHIDPATVLPEELAADIFRCLSLAGRFAASRVCTSWRRIALADRRLWARYTITLQYTRDHTMTDEERRRIIDAAAGALAALLARSDPLPFRLTCGFDVPDAIVDLIVAHMARMESLWLGTFESDDAFQRLLAQDVPVLKNFYYSLYSPGDAPRLISARWSLAPRLEELNLGCPCIWPPGCTFPALRSFTGLLPDGDTHVSTMFPNVTALHLRNVAQSFLDRLDPLPRSLTALSLHTDRQGIDCAALLRGCTAPRLRQMTIDKMRDNSCMLEIFRLFIRTFDVPWQLRTDRGVFWLSVPGPPVYEYVAVCYSASLSELVPLFHRLSELDLRPDDMLHLCAAAAVLPALISARVSLVCQQDYGVLDSLNNMRSIRAPAMQMLTLWKNVHHDFDQPIGVLLEPILRAFRSPRLARVVVETQRHGTFLQGAFAALWPLAARVDVATHEGSVAAVFPLGDPAEVRQTRIGPHDSFEWEGSAAYTEL